ncbi:hypothetical protein [Moritella sp. F3]|uniref:hypothetical protein n=1 Tax=Moritella sp. F3 TaxID=2718882 RepID=UPI0018E189AE|nr:hypothetical protein [Moritella sp. F3]GIC79710.1 hypothetical protein FMO001_44370 [Moritella sp. F1]GIC79789.1 hypothetical protein FMO003_00700 [Moritella sp. F3]
MGIDFFESGLMTICDDVKRSFWEIERFHDLTETNWKQKDKELQEHISELLSDVPEERHHDYISSYGEDLHENQILFPKIHRASIVISISSYFEDYLNQIAQIIESAVPNAKKYKHFQFEYKKKRQGSTIACAKDYILKFGSLDLKSVEGCWEDLQQINRLRNQLVHEAGYLPSSSANILNKYVSKNKNLSGLPNNKVVIRSGFITSYINLLVSFFEALDKELVKFMNA